MIVQIQVVSSLEMWSVHKFAILFNNILKNCITNFVEKVYNVFGSTTEVSILWEDQWDFFPLSIKKSTFILAGSSANERQADWMEDYPTYKYLNWKTISILLKSDKVIDFF